jgi:hypothetical protein
MEGGQTGSRLNFTRLCQKRRGIRAGAREYFVLLTLPVGTVEKIRSAAIHQRNGRIIEGANHKEIRELILATTYEPVKGTEGFVTTNGRFVDRKDAAPIALASGQAEEIAVRPWGYQAQTWCIIFRFMIPFQEKRRIANSCRAN